MALIPYLQGLGATHLFTLDNVGGSASDDLGDSVDPTNIRASDSRFSFVDAPVCEGFTHALKSTDATDFTTRTQGAVLVNRNDINGSEAGNVTGNGNSVFEYNSDVRSMHFWFRAPKVDVPTCIYKQGRTRDNFGLILGVAEGLTFQAANTGEPFLIVHSKVRIQAGRNYFVSVTWEHDSVTGAGNRIGMEINGVHQGYAQDPNGTESFQPHQDSIVIGNSSQELQTYNEANIFFATREKFLNLVGMYNNVLFKGAPSLETFERTVIPHITISADTVSAQQAALDALSGTSYADHNCVIRIMQATDATDYRLFVDNITYRPDPVAGEKDIQYLGPNTLTIENTNGSSVSSVSTPPEVEFTSGVVVGGGSIVLVENTVRVAAEADQSDITATKLVITTAGTYQFDNVNVAELENVSGGEVIVFSENAIPTITDTAGTTVFNIQGILKLNNIVNSSVYVRSGDGEESFYLNTAFGTYTRKLTSDSNSTDPWTWVVSRAGYEKVTGTAEVGEDFSQDIVYYRKDDLGRGIGAYGGRSTSNLSFQVLEDGKIYADFIGDVTAYTFFDQLETFLVSEIGCNWIADNRDAIIMRLGTDFAGQILIAPDNLVVRTNASGARKLSAFVITSQNSFDRSLRGSIAYNRSESSAEVSEAVWGYIDAEPAALGTARDSLQKAYTHSRAANGILLSGKSA